MSLLDLLPIDDDQVDILLAAVKDWYEKNGSSIDDEKGRNEMRERCADADCATAS